MGAVSTWITDLRDLPPPGPSVGQAARRRADFARAVVEAATSRVAATPWRSAVRCLGGRASKRCGHAIDLALREDAVEWSCGGCGDSGVVTHVAGLDADMSGYVPRGKTVLTDLAAATARRASREALFS
jgi:hypothetical protein